MPTDLNMPPLHVNLQQCHLLARRIAQLEVRPDPYLHRAANELERQQEANYWFYVASICQSTRTFQGTIDRKRVRGWDYLVEASRRRLGDFSAERIKGYSASDLLSLFSDDLDPAHSCADRVEERLLQLHNCAERLLQHFDGQAMAVYDRSHGRLTDPGGLLELLSTFQAFADPMQKKSVLLAGMLHEVGIWPLQDFQQLKVAMDYHAMRVALRSGMVDVAGAALARDLRERAPVSHAVNQAVRSSVSTACDLIVRESGLSVFAFDKLIWHLGRSCCFYEHEPTCGPRQGSTCLKREDCTFIDATTYVCPGSCVLDGLCKGSRDPAYRSYWETNIYTPDY
jgi:hypothetical protein